MEDMEDSTADTVVMDLPMEDLVDQVDRQICH